jgi:O-methyltransferase
MLEKVKKNIRKLANSVGYSITTTFDPIIDNDKTFLKIYERCKEYTMTPRERVYALYKAVEYIVKAKIPGDFVECGVWRGGSTMVIALTLLELKEDSRKIYLYDTFKGMTMPTEKDYDNFKKIN